MIIHNTDLMPDASEIVHYDDPGFPLYIRRGNLADYPGMRAAAHWHEDLEFIAVEKGEMNYSINGQTILLKEGDSLFVNARQLHFGFDEKKKDCLFLCILVHPSLVSFGQKLLEDSLKPMLEDAAFPFFHFSGEGKEAEDMRAKLCAVFRLKEEGSFGYRYAAAGMLAEAVASLLLIWRAGNPNGILVDTDGCDPQLELERRMVAFIEENFAAELTLDEIAGSAAVSRSTCCRLFRKYVHTSPLEFLNSYRLQNARELLETTDRSVTDIAASCGFNHMSYFSSLFQRGYGCTPRDYRKAIRKDGGRQRTAVSCCFADRFSASPEQRTG